MENIVSMPHTSVLFGRGQEEQVGNEIKNWCGTRVLLHYGRQHVTDPGLLEKIRHSLSEAGIEFCELGLVQKNSRLDLVYRGIELCREMHVDFILAVGGGSVVNSAKAIAAGACFTGSFDQLLAGLEISDALPIGVIVTVPGSGDELSNDAQVSEPKKSGRGIKLYHLKSDYLYPRFAVCNPELITSFPKHLGLSFANILIRIAESFFTNSLCVELSDCMCLGIMRTMVQMLSRLEHDPDDLDARANLMWGAVLAYTNYGMNRSEDLAVERLQAALASVYDCPHGQAAGLIFPCWLEVVLNKDPVKMAKFSNGVFGVPIYYDDPRRTAREGIARVRRLFGKLGIAASFEDLGGSGADIPLIADELGLKDCETIGSYVKFNRLECEALLSLVLTSRHSAL